MENFAFRLTTELVVGHDVETQVADYVKKYGGHKVLVHYDGGYVASSGLVEKVCEYLQEGGLEVIQLGGVVPNPRLTLVREGIELCRKEKVDFLLAIGGGSAIDSAKAIAMGIPYKGDVWDFFVEDNSVPKDVPKVSTPLGVILTIAATGSEASNSCVITDEEHELKRFCDNDVNRAKFAIENPDLTMTLPWFQTACGLTDIMSHSLERYFCSEQSGNVLTDYLCEAVFHTVMEVAEQLKADPKNYDARANMMLASSISHCQLTGLGRANNGDWSSHFIEHELSGEFDVTHGAGLAVLTPAWMRYVYRDNMDMFLKWATRVMGVQMDFANPELTVLAAIQRLEDFFGGLGLPTHLRDMPEIKGELHDEVFYKMAKRVRITNDDGTVGGMKHLDTEDIVNIFRLAM